MSFQLGVTPYNFEPSQWLEINRIKMKRSLWLYIKNQLKLLFVLILEALAPASSVEQVE